ncbi:MAG: hypothetical protein ABH864_06780 [archaeon]
MVEILDDRTLEGCNAFAEILDFVRESVKGSDEYLVVWQDNRGRWCGHRTPRRCDAQTYLETNVPEERRFENWQPMYTGGRRASPHAFFFDEFDPDLSCVA